MPSKAYLILRSAWRARLEGRTTVMQPFCEIVSHARPPATSRRSTIISATQIDLALDVELCEAELVGGGTQRSPNLKNLEHR